MTTKEKVKKTIDELPDGLLLQVDEFINNLKIKRLQQKKRVRTFSLKGKFDEMNIRKSAYE